MTLGDLLRNDMRKQQTRRSVRRTSCLRSNKLDTDFIWKDNPVEFIEQYLINPETGKPYVLYEPEKLFLTHMFALDDNGRMLYRDLIYSAIKKSGKTVFGAILAIVTSLLFGGPYAEIYCVANNLDQAEVTRFRNLPPHHQGVTTAEA